MRAGEGWGRVWMSWGELVRADWGELVESWGELGRAGESWGELGRAGELQSVLMGEGMSV